MSSSLAVPLTCVHCEKVFYGARFADVKIADRNHAAQLAQSFQKLVAHIQTEHPERGFQIGMAEAEFRTMLVLSNFRSNDTEYQKRLDISRWNVHQQTLAVKITDRQIHECVEQVLPDLKTLVQMNDDAALRKNLFTLLDGLRRQLQEPFKYNLDLQPLETAIKG